jgi:CspA family cold shock protein
MTARIRWIDHLKGYAFLANEGYQDIFFHYSQLQNDSFKSLKKGDELEFDLYQVEKGYEAKSVRRVK